MKLNIVIYNVRSMTEHENKEIERGTIQAPVRHNKTFYFKGNPEDGKNGVYFIINKRITENL